MILIEYNFEIKYRVKKTNFIDNLSKQLDYKNKKNENICLFILQNKLKNVIIVVLSVLFVLTRCSVVKKTIKTKTTKFIFRIVEFENDKKFENKKTNVVFNIENQQFRRSEIRTICNSENHYEFLLKILIIKLIKI